MASSISTSYYIGIDVGTGSARSALVDQEGHILATSTHEIQTFRSPKDSNIFEQSTTDIWANICLCIKQVLRDSGVDKEHIKGIGFDATCSLAVIGPQGEPISVSKDDANSGIGETGDRNIILWADHRAEEEANHINKSTSHVLDFVGGTMSVCVF